jgi:hypothetical protein
MKEELAAAVMAMTTELEIIAPVQIVDLTPVQMVDLIG